MIKEKILGIEIILEKTSNIFCFFFLDISCFSTDIYRKTVRFHRKSLNFAFIELKIELKKKKKKMNE